MTGEQVQRPDGTWWKRQRRASNGPKAHREDTPVGPAVLVLRTHDLDTARRLAEVRWQAFHPDTELPAGERVWRRYEAETAGQAGPLRQRISLATGHETRTFPAVRFAPPTVPR